MIYGFMDLWIYGFTDFGIWGFVFSMYFPDVRSHH